MAAPPKTSYANSGGLNIAYQVFGAGPRNLLFVPGFVSHLDLLWEHPERSAAIRRWGSFATVVTFDKRNTGLSDRTAVVPTLEERMDDLRAVLDAAGIERASIFGYSEGGPLAILFAATYPDRVDSLILAATFARAVASPDLEDRLATLEKLWGSGWPLRYFDPAADLDWAARFERSSATPRGAAEILRLNAAMDVTPALAAVAVPTLVLHRRNDPVVAIEEGRILAEGITGARFVELPGDTHMPRTDAEWQAESDLIETFLTGAHRASEPDRVLATVLFTDVVGSTERAAELGDRKWRQLLEQLHDKTSRLVRQYGGREVKRMGDGILATFDGPARGIRCATALAEWGATSGLPIRAGLHAGEVELVGDDIGGIAVHLAKRVESAAAAGKVYVSQTVRDLVAGSGISLIDRGVHDLKGIPGSWVLYEVETT